MDHKKELQGKKVWFVKQKTYQFSDENPIMIKCVVNSFDSML